MQPLNGFLMLRAKLQSRGRGVVMPDEKQQTQPGAPEKALTSIRECIHCVATQDTDGDDELARIEIDNFLDTLAEVAISIARRKEEKVQ